MTTTADLFAIAVTALQGTTNAGANVFSALDWPTWNNSYPCLYIHAPTEDKESLGRVGGPQFTVTATLTVEARFQAPAVAVSGPFDAGAAIVENALFLLGAQIEKALINYDPLMALLQKFSFIRTHMSLTADGEQHLGNLTTQIGLEFYQGPEDFYQTPTSVITEISVTTDLTNVFDRSGTYANPPFPSSVNPAPRTSGPDGRAEGYTQFNPNP